MATHQPANEPAEQHFELYIAGASTISTRAILHIQQFIRNELGGRATLQIVDVHQQNHLALEEQLVALPLLVRRHPLPERKFLGDLSDLSRLRQALDLT